MTASITAVKAPLCRPGLATFRSVIRDVSTAGSKTEAAFIG